MQATTEATLRPLVEALLAPLFEAIESDPRMPSVERLDRRFFKLYEELGETSQAYLSVTGSNTKKQTYEDLDTEKVDSFIVYVDILLSVAHLVLDRTEIAMLKTAIATHLCTRIEERTHKAQGDLLKAALASAGVCHTAVRNHSTDGLYPCYVSLLHSNATMFDLLLQDPRPSAFAPTQSERLAWLTELVQQKTSKWKAIRTKND